MELLTPDEVSELTGLSIETLAQWRSQKKHLPYLKVGRLVRYDRRDIDRYFETCRVSVSAERRQR
jgi:excisionase family DNA binding protein